MKVCFPVATDDGLDSVVYGHFGSAPLFLLVDTESNTINSINNQDLGHAHGMCSPLKALGGFSIDLLVVGGIGAGAINKLNALGIRVFRAGDTTIQKNLDLFKNKALFEITLNDACSQHGGCGH